MIDWFALLGEPRRPWLDPEALKKKFLQLSAEVHPDRVHAGSEAEKRAAQDRYTALNGAYHGLREPKDRLRHLLQLELGSRPREVEEIQPGMMDLFFEVSRLCREADQFLKEKEKARSPLLQVAWFEPGQKWVESLRALQQVLRAKEEDLLAELKGLDSAWPDKSPETLKRLEELYRSFSYFNRWAGQIQERIIQLSI